MLRRCSLRLQGTSPSQLVQRTEVIFLPGSPRRALSPARAAALSDWLCSRAPFFMPQAAVAGLQGGGDAAAAVVPRADQGGERDRLSGPGRGGSHVRGTGRGTAR